MCYLQCYGILHSEYCKWSLVAYAYINPEFASFIEKWQVNIKIISVCNICNIEQCAVQGVLCKPVLIGTPG